VRHDSRHKRKPERSKAEVLFSLPEIEKAAERIAEGIANQLPDEIVVVAILQGSRRFARLLSRMLSIRKIKVKMRSIRIERTRKMSLKKPEVLKDSLGPKALSGKVVVLVDDVVDEGKTLRAAQDFLRRFRPARILTVALVKKRKRPMTKLQLDAVGFDLNWPKKIAEQKWIYGFGMDKGGRFRKESSIMVSEIESRQGEASYPRKSPRSASDIHP